MATPRKKPEDKLKSGQPTAYRPHFVEQAAKLCVLGATDMELADFFNVSLATITNWKNAHPEFLGALKSGKSFSDERVERSLFHKAIGYSFDAEEIFQYQGEIVRTKVRKHIPPDTTAAIFWLKNRRKDRWRDVHKHEHGPQGAFDGLSDRELMELLVKEAEEAQQLLEYHGDEADKSE